MMKHLNKITISILAAIAIANSSNVTAHEINSHQLQTMCATTPLANECSTGERAKNLHYFAGEHGANIKDQNYYCSPYKDYNFALKTIDIRDDGMCDQNGEISYEQYAKWGEGWNNPLGKGGFGIAFSNYSTYLDMLQVGVVLEDAVWPRADHGGDGRFNSHFFDPQQGGLQLSGPKASWGKHTDAVTWAIWGEEFDTVGSGIRQNHYSLQQAWKYYADAFSATTLIERKNNQANLFVALGHVVHLLQDLHSTAHTRNDAHAHGDVFERWGRAEYGGFNMEGGSVNSSNNAQVTAAVKVLPSLKYSRHIDFFTHEAKFVSESYFSMDTICMSSKTHLFDEEEERNREEQTENETEGVFDYLINEKLDNIDKNYGNRCRYKKGSDSGDFYEHKKPRSNGVELWDYSHKRKIGQFPDDGRKIYDHFDALDLEDGRYRYSLGEEHLLGLLRTDFLFSHRDTIRTPDDESVLVQNALTLMSRSVASTEGFIDYFFRGRILALQVDNSSTKTLNEGVEADNSQENDDIAPGIYLVNTADASTVAKADENLVTMRKGSTVSIFGDNTEGIRGKVFTKAITNDLKPCDHKSIKDIIANCDFELIPELELFDGLKEVPSIQKEQLNEEESEVIGSEVAHISPTFTILYEGKIGKEHGLATTTIDVKLPTGTFDYVGFEDNVAKLKVFDYILTGDKKNQGVVINNPILLAKIKEEPKLLTLVYCDGDKPLSKASCDNDLYHHFEMLDDRSATITRLNGRTSKTRLPSDKYKLALAYGIPRLSSSFQLYASSEPNRLFTLNLSKDFYEVEAHQQTQQYSRFDVKSLTKEKIPFIVTENNTIITTTIGPKPSFNEARVAKGYTSFEYKPLPIKVEIYDSNIDKLSDISSNMDGFSYSVDVGELKKGLYYVRYRHPYINDNIIPYAKGNDASNTYIGSHGAIMPFVITGDVVVTTSLDNKEFTYNVTDKPLKVRRSSRDDSTLEAKISINNDQYLSLNRNKRGKTSFRINNEKHAKKIPSVVETLCGESMRPTYKNTTFDILSEPETDEFSRFISGGGTLVNGELTVKAIYQCASKNYRDKTIKEVEYSVQVLFDNVLALKE